MILGWCSNLNNIFTSCRIFGNVLNGSTFGITLHAHGGFQVVLPLSKHLNMVELVPEPKAVKMFMSYHSLMFPVSYGNTLGGVVRSSKLEFGWRVWHLSRDCISSLSKLSTIVVVSPIILYYIMVWWRMYDKSNYVVIMWLQWENWSLCWSFK